LASGVHFYELDRQTLMIIFALTLAVLALVAVTFVSSFASSNRRRS